ncbi:bifunctional adenosylcobinamide kinase/adenosylcobinamide-phosphate guanylyltransferase [Sphingomonas sp.]|uniref:bifunctional adenosylcobinamide kinase/adenosylcobinamide-phosphate guanylyltransferase n=1 Tax=Sphingomonas sp. TaxID=28214 RepID=UPI000DB6DBFD|nr:bifunctional adenosylcobinamide kinase/adenosylcobinamide-phosphate guanylyltransferase [Sphingomonas sp.]PZU09520.1 MAG: bifunctional adenosylcobinamide kinase/adenosylcobinamide-phosphate guanylyltransferase [Sphingomonas sp.]
MNEGARTRLVLGGARSGKSGLAQRLAEVGGGDLVFLATAEAYDDEMRERIARHRADRDARWRTVEAPRDLVAAIAREDGEGRTLLVDCLTLWLSNLLLAGEDLDAAGAALGEAIGTVRGRIILVSNEVGFGIVPENALARAFRDEQGRLNQRIAARCEAVDLVVAGIGMRIK